MKYTWLNTENIYKINVNIKKIKHMSGKKRKHNRRSALPQAPFFTQPVDGIHSRKNQTNPKGYNKAPMVRKNGQR